MVMPETIGGYAILNEIGSGGFGTVYRAYNPSSGRVVALKTLDPKHTDPDAVERFRREALLTSEIDHPNVIRILDEGEDSGTRFIVMEMMALSLREALSAGRLPISRAMDICSQSALGLKTAHDRKTIHRDIKPANILIDSNGAVKVSDFGIAHADDLPNLTATGVWIGSGRYMSPEQIMDSKRVDARSDIYSLGVTLYEMLTGMRYGLGESAKASRPAIPAKLEHIVNKCLEMDRERRYGSVSDLLQEVSNPALVNRCALIDFYEATDGDNWKRNDNWLTDKPLDEWHGVTANGDGVVTHLYIWHKPAQNNPEGTSSNNLVGEIPSGIAYLTELEYLNLADNRLRGSIPPELGNLTKLEWLDLRSNRLSGNIPPELGRLTKLRGFNLSDNRLWGSIPPELGSATELEALSLSDNSLSGNIPDELGTLHELKFLVLRRNQFMGHIPHSLCDHNQLMALNLSGNNWTGCIPRALFDIRWNDLNEIALPVCDD